MVIYHRRSCRVALAQIAIACLCPVPIVFELFGLRIQREICTAERGSGQPRQMTLDSACITQVGHYRMRCHDMFMPVARIRRTFNFRYFKQAVGNRLQHLENPALHFRQVHLPFHRTLAQSSQS